MTEIIDIKKQHTTESAKLQDSTMKYIPLCKDGKWTIFMLEAYVKNKCMCMWIIELLCKWHTIEIIEFTQFVMSIIWVVYMYNGWQWVMIFIIVLSTSEYESSSRPRTNSKNKHMITCENPNSEESETAQIASSADENKDSSSDKIDSENMNAVIQQTENNDQSQITGMYTRLVAKSGYKYI